MGTVLTFGRHGGWIVEECVDPSVNQGMHVVKLIDKDMGCWREDLVCQTFLPIDAELILQLPLCTTWPKHKLIWHFTPRGDFSVKSAYHSVR